MALPVISSRPSYAPSSVSSVSRVACEFLSDPSLPSSPVALLQAFVAAAGVFNNCTQDVQASAPLRVFGNA